MKPTIENRIRKLEDIYISTPTYVLAENAAGEGIECTVKEMVENGYSFCKVLRGGRNSDDAMEYILDCILYQNGMYDQDFFTDVYRQRAQKKLAADPDAVEHRREEINKEIEERNGRKYNPDTSKYE